MKKVFVAMSGGVDSSVVAALLKRGRFLPAGRQVDVVGVFMKPWSPEQGDCLWKEDREDALRAAAKLDIPLLTWDLSREYERYVVRYMVEGYKRGITPNPDVFCNKFIKFGAFLDKALKMGADFIATGHYVRKQTTYNKQQTTREKKYKKSSVVSYKLLVGIDKNKDQSYFLYTLNQERLKHCLFPIGDYTKDQVRQMAREFGLPNWNKKDSQGICFVGPLEVKEFLKSRIKPKRGLVVRKSDAKVIGEHDGVWFYTIGQRHGIQITQDSKPYYVVDKDLKKNILYVEGEPGIVNYELRITDFHWIRKENVPLKCKVKTRYRQKDLDCQIVKNGSASALVELNARTAIAPGQAAVFYKGNEVLGGGVIV